MLQVFLRLNTAHNYLSLYAHRLTLYNHELEWSETYMKLLLSLFPENLKPAVHLASSIPISPAVCFRSAVGQ